MSDILGLWKISIPNYGEVFYSPVARIDCDCMACGCNFYNPSAETIYETERWAGATTVRAKCAEHGWGFRINDVPHVAEVCKLLEKYGVKYTEFCDTIPGTFDLNQEFVETEPMMLNVQYNGAFPIGWSQDDCDIVQRLLHTGKIIILVTQIHEKDGEIKYVPNC